MNAFTVFHTTLSLLPVGFGFAALVRHGAINPATRTGKWYLGTMFAATISSFGFLPALGFTPGQVLTLFTLGLLTLGTSTLRGHWRGPGYVQTIALSASYLMLMVFFSTEMLKHFPLSHPFASSADDPSLIPIRLSLLCVFLVGIVWQSLKIRSANRQLARLNRIVYRHAA